MDTLKRISFLIHYPECWDTVAYPTLEDAIWEILSCEFEIDAKICTTCGKKQRDESR